MRIWHIITILVWLIALTANANIFYDENKIIQLLNACYEYPKGGPQTDETQFFLNSQIVASALAKAFEGTQMSEESATGFLAHSLMETRHFKNFVQVTDGNYCTPEFQKKADGNGYKPISQKQYCEQINKCSRKAVASASDVDGIGFGLLQNTGCDTHLSVLHYIKTGEWKAAWLFGVESSVGKFEKKKWSGSLISKCESEASKGIKSNDCYSRKLDRGCAPDELKKLKKIYQKKYPGTVSDKQWNLYMDPLMAVNLCTPGGPQVMANAAVAFWVGKCGHLPKGGKRTECLNGSASVTKGDRAIIYEKIQKCVKKIKSTPSSLGSGENIQ